MNYLDILLLLPLLYGAYKGFSRGFVIEVATLLGLILGVYVAIKFSDYTENILRDFLDISSKYLSYIALSVTFLLVVVAIYLLGKMLTKLVDIVSLGLVNKLLGTVLGIAKSFVILCIILLIADALDDKFQFMNKEVKENSLFYNPFLNFAQQMYNMIRF
ncbi:MULTISPECIES: CvpA family protein [Culturomica]|uniref:CvpA family protein n=1 Tax=Culturomica TaxID=1926651 RepID=UPI0003364097|nr:MULTISPECIES: CvpA family protein [Odoribacteraceae]RHV93201.1 CvpA family protein [Odoribacter sp. OF09-27XD]CCZ07718.1 colicin V production protein [Odoribacter sp. CAG:788]HBO25559.1 CvpA family protein [Culturomica sp.]